MHNPSETAYPIAVAFQGTTFAKVESPAHTALGREILATAGYPADDRFSLYNILAAGDFQMVRLDESVDLRRQGAERFIVFESDRDFKFKLNEREGLWGVSTITGADLYALAKPAVGHAVFQINQHGEARQLEPEDRIELGHAGVEHFKTAPMRKHLYEIIINGRKTEVRDARVTFDQLVALAYPGPAPQPNIAYTVTYRKVASFPHEGELGAGGFVTVKDGSVFNVGRTIQS